MERDFDLLDGEYKTSSTKEVQFIEALQAVDKRVRRYSGRGMCGRECPAVYCDDSLEESEVVMLLDEAGVDYRIDSLGMGKIVYTG